MDNPPLTYLIVTAPGVSKRENDELSSLGPVVIVGGFMARPDQRKTASPLVRAVEKYGADNVLTIEMREAPSCCFRRRTLSAPVERVFGGELGGELKFEFKKGERTHS